MEKKINRMANGKIETYEESARVISLYLNEFCDKSLPYPEMIADAARRAETEICNLRKMKRECPKCGIDTIRLSIMKSSY